MGRRPCRLLHTIVGPATLTRRCETRGGVVFPRGAKIRIEGWHRGRASITDAEGRQMLGVARYDLRVPGLDARTREYYGFEP